jgi:hypothetical protein
VVVEWGGGGIDGLGDQYLKTLTCVLLSISSTIL